MIRFCINYERGATDQPLDSDDENDQDERFERGTTWYSCDDKETFLDVCDKLDLTTDSERQRYFLWCKTEYNRGNDPLFKTKRHCLYFPNPMLGKKSKKANRKWTFQAGTQFPRPTGELWDKHIQKSTTRTQPTGSGFTATKLQYQNLNNPTWIVIRHGPKF